MLAIARGLMARPKLMMLDEPSLGLAPIIVNQIMEILKEVNEGCLLYTSSMNWMKKSLIHGGFFGFIGNSFLGYRFFLLTGYHK